MYIYFEQQFEWDVDKAAANLAKHDVWFADAVEVLFDPDALTVLAPFADEERFVTVGRDSLNQVLTVVYCWRGVRIRMISARRASRQERRQYEEGP